MAADIENDMFLCNLMIITFIAMGFVTLFAG